VALADTVAQRIGVRVEPVVDTWGACSERFQRGELDVISNISMTDERGAYTHRRTPTFPTSSSCAAAHRLGGSVAARGAWVSFGVYYLSALTQALGRDAVVEFEGHDQLLRALLRPDRRGGHRAQHRQHASAG
jgi:hypothetical protein